MISIDSEMLLSLSSLAGTAVENMTNGFNKLKMVVTHEDWNCRERKVINQNIEQIHKDAAALQNFTQEYLNGIKTSANRFDEANTHTVKAFEDVNHSLAGFFAVATPLAATANTKTQDLIGVTTGSQKMNDLLAEYEATGMTEPLRVCPFEDVNLNTK